MTLRSLGGLAMSGGVQGLLNARNSGRCKNAYSYGNFFKIICHTNNKEYFAEKGLLMTEIIKVKVSTYVNIRNNRFDEDIK